MAQFMLMSSVSLPTDAEPVKAAAKSFKNRRHTLCPGALAGRPLAALLSESPVLKIRALSTGQRVAPSAPPPQSWGQRGMMIEAGDGDPAGFC